MHVAHEAKREPSTSTAHAMCAESVVETAASAVRKIAPLWSLQNFVAVNPYLAFTDRSFGDTAEVMARVAGARVTMRRELYLNALAEGRIQQRDLDAALDEASSNRTEFGTSARLLRRCAGPGWNPERLRLRTVADVASELTGRNWSRQVTDRISFWAAAHFDRGQSMWRSPWQDRSPYEAWRAEAALDRTPEVMGLTGYRASVRALPESPDEMIVAAETRLGIPRAGLETYFHRLSRSIGGWVAYARGLGWDAALHGDSENSATDLLAVRLAWEICLLDNIPGLEAVWFGWRHSFSEGRRERDPELELDLILHGAYEHSAQRRLLASLSPNPVRRPPDLRPRIQAVFCIDVRSEVIRRHLEAQSPEIETMGFAGFFGVAMKHVALGRQDGGSHCPALLVPRYRIEEAFEGVSERQAQRWARQHAQRGRFAKAWKAFRSGAVSSFGFVETIGLGYAAKLVGDTLGLTRPTPDPRYSGHSSHSAAHLAPQLEPSEQNESGIPHADRVALAEGILRGLTLTTGLARIVLFVGHGATTVNNPHATGLDCGACGGHDGKENARVAARILNDSMARRALRDRGIDVPEDTLFVAGHHDTTTDELSILDRSLVPLSHRHDLDELLNCFDAASSSARRERSRALGIPSHASVDEAVRARSCDWSQVRPEWGLAGCQAFIVAPRYRTVGRNLGGRAFLHSYDWRRDKDFSTLEQIMTAPMVVASWISLQYFASTVDNATFGAGDKVLHNVVGALGVLEGNGGDLRVGLPLQSVHSGTQWVHEPLRLSVIIEAPRDAIERVIRQHAALRELTDNGWIHLFSMDELGVVTHRYRGDARWQALDQSHAIQVSDDQSPSETYHESTTSRSRIEESYPIV